MQGERRAKDSTTEFLLIQNCWTGCPIRVATEAHAWERSIVCSHHRTTEPVRVDEGGTSQKQTWQYRLQLWGRLHQENHSQALRGETETTKIGYTGETIAWAVQNGTRQDKKSVDIPYELLSFPGDSIEQLRPNARWVDDGRSPRKPTS